MSHDPLAQEIKDYYLSQKLNSKTMDKLLTVNNTRKRKSFYLFPIAACIVTFLVAFGFYKNWLGEYPMTTKVAQEMFANHIKEEQMSIKSNDYTNIQSTLNLLTFSIRPTQTTQLASLTLQGGRYCSVDGIKAAQLRFLDENNKRKTLFVVADSKFDIISPMTIHLENGQVKLWQDNGRLYGLAE